MIKRARGLVEHRLFKFMADASYGVYLIHLPLLAVVISALTRFHFFIALPPTVRFLFCLAVMTPLVYGLAFLAFKFVEIPGINLGRKIVKRIR